MLRSYCLWQTIYVEDVLNTRARHNSKIIGRTVTVNMFALQCAIFAFRYDCRIYRYDLQLQIFFYSKCYRTRCYAFFSVMVKSISRIVISLVLSCRIFPYLHSLVVLLWKRLHIKHIFLVYSQGHYVVMIFVFRRWRGPLLHTFVCRNNTFVRVRNVVYFRDRNFTRVILFRFGITKNSPRLVDGYRRVPGHAVSVAGNRFSNDRHLQHTVCFARYLDRFNMSFVFFDLKNDKSVNHIFRLVRRQRVW